MVLIQTLAQLSRIFIIFFIFNENKIKFSFELYLPKDTTLWPFLNCIVFDSILKGLIQPVLGSFSINLADIALKTRLRLDRKYKKISDAFFKSN